MGYSPESMRDMSPDAASPYPDRPIRPLPKRRLRERLSPEAAGSIKYPPVPKVTPPLFYHPYSLQDESAINGGVESQHPSERERADEIDRNYISRRNGEEIESDDDEIAYRSRVYSRPSVDTTGRSCRFVQKPDSKQVNPQAPASAASSADGYDSFENTNNKKKRKIPTPGDSGISGLHLATDKMAAAGPEELLEDLVHSPGSTHGISGAGRGRYGRNRNGRSPLRTLSDASSNWGNGRTVKQRQPQWSPSSESPGIISRSIANAIADKNPITPARGQENMSLLQQQASKKSGPASAQFTFTCDSYIPGTVSWPGLNSSPAIHQSQATMRMVSTHATQTSPSIPTGRNVTNGSAQVRQGHAASNQTPNGSKHKPAQAATSKKTRRRTGKEYLVAARQRRHQQEFRNYHHPPSAEDIWICEFCEYERIFGTPPEALIKQYEIKERRLRKQEAERKRLLEKAKMKGRKGRKGNKTTSKSNSMPHDRQTQSSTQQALLGSQLQAQSQSQSQSTQSEEYYDDEFDDLDAQDDPPPPSPVAPPVLPADGNTQTESVIYTGI